jgi:hypothetical protein
VFWRFDNNGTVLDYEAWVLSLDLFTSATRTNLHSPAAMKGTIKSICGEQARVGNNTDSMQDCFEMLAARPLGRLDEA